MRSRSWTARSICASTTSITLAVAYSFWHTHLQTSMSRRFHMIRDSLWCISAHRDLRYVGLENDNRSEIAYGIPPMGKYDEYFGRNIVSIIQRRNTAVLPRSPSRRLRCSARGLDNPTSLPLLLLR